MLKPVEDFKIEVDGKLKIWRYVSKNIFDKLLDDRRLYFPSARSLSKHDKFEGSISDVILRQELGDTTLTEEEMRILKKGYQKMPASKSFEELLDMVNISCWHISNFESFLMWKVYGSKQSIAIQTSVEKLVDAIVPYTAPNAKGAEDLYFGRVNYIDFASEEMDTGMELRFFHKKKEFSLENEFRLLVSLRLACEFRAANPGPGIKVALKGLDFIERVYVSPLESENYEKDIKSIIDKHGVSITVQRSSLSNYPVY